MNRVTQITRNLLLAYLMSAAVCFARTAELNVRVQYPTQANDVILVAVKDNEMVLRPQGNDRGGRAYLNIQELQRQRVTLLFLFPQSYYTAIEKLEEGQALSSLPAIKKEAAPLLDYMPLSVLPGNLMPTVLSYLDALRETQQWQEAVAVATRIPLAMAPESALRHVGDLALALQDADEMTVLNRLHAHIVNTREMDFNRLTLLMGLADEWRKRGEYLRAYQLYRKVQIVEGPNQVLARLWVAYCSFYLGHDLIPEVFLEVLPEMEPTTPGYSLRELIKARLRIREEAFEAAMRSAAEGKTYANAIDPWYPELLYTVALLYEKRGMHGAALAAYREVSILFSDSQWAAESLKALENLTSEAPAL